MREERPTDISQCCEAGRMKHGYLRVGTSQTIGEKTQHFNLLRNSRPTTTLAGRVVLPVFCGVAEFERTVIGVIARFVRRITVTGCPERRTWRWRVCKLLPCGQKLLLYNLRAERLASMSFQPTESVSWSRGGHPDPCSFFSHGNNALWKHTMAYSGAETRLTVIQRTNISMTPCTASSCWREAEWKRRRCNSTRPWNTRRTASGRSEVWNAQDSIPRTSACSSRPPAE